MSNPAGTYQHGVLDELTRSVRSPARQGALVLGPAWTGKTTLLRDAGLVLRQAGFSPVFLSGGSISKGSMGCAQAVLSTLEATKKDAVALQLSTSAGDSVSEAVETMNAIAELLSEPVLILDALDEAESLRDLVSQLEPIIARAKGWRYLMASRPDPHARRRLQRWLDIFELEEESGRVSLTTPRGNTLGVGDQLSGLWASGREEVESLLNSLDTDPLGRKLLLRLSLCGPQSHEELLTAFCVDLRQLKVAINRLGMRRIVTYLKSGDLTVGQDIISRRVLERQLMHRPFSLSELSFGTEEGESDPLLDSVYQNRGGANELGATYSIVLGSRGSGKSALVRRVTEGKQLLSRDLIAAPIVASSSALTRLVSRDRWDDHDSLRAAWTLLLAAEVAIRLPDGASDSLKIRARKILAASGKPAHMNVGQRILQWFRTTLGGSKLQFSLGLVKLDAPLGSPAGRATVDLEKFLVDADEAFVRAGSGVLCLLDRVDEILKHDRAKQEACVQALLQVERELSALSHFECIKMVVFLRDDLLQAYDIQEKNKLVSRTLRLDWSTDDWLTVLVRRLAANPSLAWLYDVIALDKPAEAVLALSKLLPSSVESLPVDRWLFESLRDGNGQISPRLAVLLLLFARDLSPNRGQMVSDLPLFQEGILRTAMDRVSELAYDEVVSDFKVASTFVSNCRAAKLTKFQFDEVSPLFGAFDGNASDQVRALERLGFLERVAVAENNTVSVYFRIPQVFSRSWAH